MPEHPNPFHSADSPFPGDGNCPRCHELLRDRTLRVLRQACYNCTNPMTFALCETGGMILCGPDGFTDWELELAWRHDCVMEQRSSERAGSTYLANICLRCAAFIGRNLLWGSEATSMWDIQTGHECGRCRTSFRLAGKELKKTCNAPVPPVNSPKLLQLVDLTSRALAQARRDPTKRTRAIVGGWREAQKAGWTGSTGEWYRLVRQSNQ